MRKIIGPSECPGEHAHDVISIMIFEHEWSLSFKAEILDTAVTGTNWTLLYHTCRKSYTTNNLGVPVNLLWYQSLFMHSTQNYDSHLKWRDTWFRLENQIEKQVILVQTKMKRVVRKSPLQVLGPFIFIPFLRDQDDKLFEAASSRVKKRCAVVPPNNCHGPVRSLWGKAG